jgi:hypothetical protein
MIPFIPWYIELATLVTNVVIAAGVWMIVSAGTRRSGSSQPDSERFGSGAGFSSLPGLGRPWFSLPRRRPS